MTKQNATRRKIGVLLAVMGIVGLGIAAGLWQANSRKPEPLAINGIYLYESKPVVDFNLTDQAGQTLTRADWRGQWTVIYFGYTSCPDACPTTFAQLKQVRPMLVPDASAEPIEFMLISVDPARDTPERIAAYVASFDPAFGGATGSREELDKLTQSLGIYYKIQESQEDEEFYLVDHSSGLLVINPQTELQAVLSPPFNPKTMADDLRRIFAQFEHS